jgi:hypothetical protein
MASRSRSTSVGRRSWKESGRETSRPLTIYRRVITLVLCLVLVGAFLAALWYVPKGDKADRWTFERLLITTYDRGAAPPLVFAKNDEAAIPDFFGEDLAGRGTDADNLLREIRALPESSADAMFLYLAGHGMSREAKGDGDAREVAFLLPSDYDTNAPTERVNVTTLLTAVAQHPSKRKLLVIDYGPLERDLRIGTAVNNFAGVLESEFLRMFASGGEEKLLKDGDVLIVIASHRRWEQSLVSPVDGRSAFNYFALEALTSPEANADAICPDGGKSNQRISALEFARFVQWQVDHWAWNATSQQRTQRPLVLFADSSSEPAAVEFERLLKKEELDQDPVLTRLAKMTLRDAPKPAAKEEGEKSAEKAAGRVLPIAMLALAQAAEPAEGEKKPMEAASEKPPMKPAEPAEPKTPPPLAWVSSQHHALDLLLGADALNMENARGGWAAVDADHVQVRQQLEALLQLQQSRLNPNNAPGDLADPLSTRTREAVLNWAQASKRWEEFPEIIAAMHVRDRMLAEFALLQELVDRVDDIYLTRVNQAAIDAVESLAALCDKLEREGVIDERIRDAGNTLYSAAPSEGKYSSANEVGQAAVTAWNARGSLIDALRIAFVSQPPEAGKDPGLWLGRWQILLHAPLAFISPEATSSAFSKPAQARMKLAVATKLFDASAKNVQVPTPSDRTEVVARVASARMQWLELQERFCRLTPPQMDPISLSGIGRDVAAFNAAAQAIAQRRENAAAALRTQAITDDWQRDRAARLLGVADPSEAAPLANYKLIDKPVFLRLAGPRDRSGQMQSDAISLSTDKPLALVWNIESMAALPLDRMKLKFEFDDEAVQVENHEQKPVSAGVESRASDFVKGRELTLHLLARHEVSAEESKKPPVLKITLTYDRTRSVAAESRLVLPNSRYLQVVLEAGELNLNLRELDRRSENAKAFLVRAAEVIGNDAPAAGSCFHVPLRPYPSGVTSYRLALFNRSEGKRAIKAQWFAPVDTDATSPEWLDVRRLTSREPLSDPIALAFDKFGELELPLYPPPKAPAAGTAPPAPPAEGGAIKNVSLNRGLICVLSDDSDREWKQYLWVTARPLRPRDYLSATAEFDAKTSTARVSVKPKGEASPSEPAPLIGDPLGTERIVFGTPDKKRQELSGTVAAGQPPTLTNPLRFAAKIDNYPRGFQFRIQSSAQVVAAAPEAYAALELFAEPEVPMSGKPPEPLGKITYWQKPQKLNYRVHADFLEDRQCALRLSLNGGVDTPLELFADDRAFDLQCLKSEPGAPPKFIVKCDTQDFAGSFEGDTFAGSRRMAYRAEVVRRAGERWEALSPPVFDERTIIIDRLPPEIVHRKQDKTIVLGSKGVVSFVFEVQDGNGDNDDSASGVRLEDIAWSTSEKPDGAQPIKDLLPTEISDTQPRRRWELRAQVDPKLLKKPDTFTVWIHAKDASGRPATSRGVISVTVNQPVPDKEFTVKEKVPKGK